MSTHPKTSRFRNRTTRKLGFECLEDRWLPSQLTPIVDEPFEHDDHAEQFRHESEDQAEVKGASSEQPDEEQSDRFETEHDETSTHETVSSLKQNEPEDVPVEIDDGPSEVPMGSHSDDDDATDEDNHAVLPPGSPAPSAESASSPPREPENSPLEDDTAGEVSVALADAPTEAPTVASPGGEPVSERDGAVVLGAARGGAVDRPGATPASLPQAPDLWIMSPQVAESRGAMEIPSPLPNEAGASGSEEVPAPPREFTGLISDVVVGSLHDIEEGLRHLMNALKEDAAKFYVVTGGIDLISWLTPLVFAALTLDLARRHLRRDPLDADPLALQTVRSFGFHHPPADHLP